MASNEAFQKAMRYSGIGFQIAAAFGLGFWLGWQLDKWMGNKKPFATLLLALLFLGVGMYAALKDFLSMQQAGDKSAKKKRPNE